MSSNESNTAREEVVQYLIGELWGPVTSLPAGAKPLPDPDSDNVYHFPGDEQDVKYFDPETNELVIQGMRPEVLYGTGIIHYPDADDDQPQDATIGTYIDDNSEPKIVVKNATLDGSDDGDGAFAIEQSQKLRPSAMGITFRVSGSTPSASNIKVGFSGAVYEPFDVKFEGYGKSTWFRRRKVSASASVTFSKLRQNLDTLIPLEFEGDASSNLALLCRSREASSLTDDLVITIVVKHRGERSNKEDVLQSQMKVTITNGGEFLGTVEELSGNDSELEEINFIYRHVKNYATGHGTAVEWDPTNDNSPVTELRTVAIPRFYQETLNFNATDNVYDMNQIADLEKPDADLRAHLETITASYKEWIDSNERLLQQEGSFSGPGERLIQKTRKLLGRMEAGIETLFAEDNKNVLLAFRLANKAMYLQQQNGKREIRKWNRPEKGSAALKFADIKDPDEHTFGKWRIFQIGFLLLSINGLVDDDHEDREEVDLIFFPTGGGKTEAYLGAAALTILYRRIAKSDEIGGVDVLMRYTLRLLTIQQFERSSGLISALEVLRRQKPQLLGQKPISIGVWLGSKTTPNESAEAVALHKKGIKNSFEDSNPFVLSRCPWCSAEFGFDKQREQWNGYSVLGSPKKLRFQCPDPKCEFASDENPLPIWITDEDVYAEQPSFILATVDKFARMAWEPRARTLFNLDSAGNRVGPPPSLIIQDELHLISGPLGSMVGLYEPVIEALCTDERNGKIIKPKIVASTATTRRYESQIFALYGRAKVSLFPQAVNRVNETFFSKVDRHPDGTPREGTLYLGVNPSTYATGQMAASVVAAVLMQAPNLRPEGDKQMDYYSTSMWFFNSLRELGMTLTLMQSVVLDKIRGMSLYRRLPNGAKPRWPSTIMELTSRISSNAIKSSLDDLSSPAGQPGFVTTCLASSIMEVGVDVQRLGLLTIMSQPKSTSQYIQVSGRVGRAKNGPGLVVMLYNAQRSRDRSVYERFTAYHSRLYAQVEPVTVTPFSIPAMRHGLVGALLSAYRMYSQEASSSEQPNDSVFVKASEVIKARLSLIAPQAEKFDDFEKQVSKFERHWKRYEPPRWNYSMDEEAGDVPEHPAPALMRGRRERLADYPGDQSEMVPRSLRSVDGQTELRVSHNPYAFTTQEEEA
jgi:hypothetical protein